MTAPLRAEGSLAEHDFPDLVKSLHEGHWSGALTLTHMGIAKSIVVQDGRMVFASSTSRDERLGELLLRRGKISLKQYIAAGSAMVPGKRLGTILVEQQALDAKDLVRSVVDHSQEIIYGAFHWTEGRYRLDERAASPEAITLRMSTPDMIVEGIRRIESWGRIERGVGGVSARYARSEDYEAVIRPMALSLEKRAILTGLLDTTDVQTLCTRSTLSDFEVCRTLWAFRVIGIVRRMDDEPGPKEPLAEDEGLGFVLTEE